MTTGLSLNDVKKAISLLTEKHSMDSVKINNLSTLLENALTESTVIAGNGITITKNSDGNYLFEATESEAGMAALEQEVATATATAVAATAVAVAAQTTADGAASVASSAGGMAAVATAASNANTAGKQNNLTIITAPASGAGSLALDTNNANLTYTPLDKTAIKFTELDETPASLSGSGGKHLKVNSGGTALELTDAPISGGGAAVWFRARMDAHLNSVTNTGVLEEDMVDLTVDAAPSSNSPLDGATGVFTVPAGEGGVYMLGCEALLAMTVDGNGLWDKKIFLKKQASGQSTWTNIYTGRWKDSPNDGDAYICLSMSDLFELSAGDKVKVVVYAKTFAYYIQCQCRGQAADAHGSAGGTTGFWGYKVA